ncbi:HNH endonuclease [Candidatus Poriferisodalis sp.]|uniref:HNH endonuclease n=1 Tax=Candidatus Poriferisodalis sp. TaxID=3101277 RepID=UPI003B017E88
MSSDGTGRSVRLDPIQGVLEILDRAAMTGTNKLGLLLTLLDLAPTLDGDAATISPIRVAERYLEIHWEHVRPYQGVTLRQSSARKERGDGTTADDTTVMQEVHRLRTLLTERRRGDLRDKPLEFVKRSIERLEWHSDWEEASETALARVRASLLKNPVRLLQQLPGNPDPFLYDSPSGREGLTLLPGVAESLTRFAGILRPLIEFRFAQEVVRINHETLNLPVDDVYSHLFGHERIMPPQKMRERLVQIQQGRCIFTGASLPTAGDSLELDHVVPWSRARLSQVENFLMTTRSVNSTKSDSMLGPAAIERWLRHLDANSAAIRDCAHEHNWPSNLHSVRQVVLHMYEALDATTGVWEFDRGIQPLGNDGKSRVIALLR